MIIRKAESKDRQLWDAFVGEHSLGSLQQSWTWGDFQEDYGFKIFRLIVEKNKQIIGLVQAFLYDMPTGKLYLYCSRGPMINEKTENRNKEYALGLILRRLQEIAKINNAIFLRVDPLIEIDKPNFLNDWLMKANSQRPVAIYRAFKQMQPEETLVLDLSGDEKEILKEMKSKWRYNIRLATRKGVKITTPAKGGVDIFYKLATQTAERDGFYYHTKKYYEKLIEKLGNRAKIFIATVNDKPIVANIMLYFKDTVIYAHGASSDEHKNLMAPHLLQWEAIKDAKNKGFKYYDFFGIARSGEKKDSWTGITRFKMGFAPEDSKFARYVQYIGAFDIIYSKFWYWLIKFAKRAKK